MYSPKELYQKIDQSRLDEKEKLKLRDWYRERHIQATERSLWLLDMVGRWRKWKLSRLQNKVLERLK